MSNSNNQVEILAGLKTSFLDRTYESSSLYRPQFITNNSEKGEKVLVSIEQALLKCDSFMISVAFITESGIEPLLQTLKELEKRNIPGKVLTTDYLTFTDPKALQKLSSLRNIEVRMMKTDHGEEGFHTKGYIFRNDETYQILIGSSNLTLNAITRNHEWNTRIVSSENGEMTKDILDEFERLWNAPSTFRYEDIMEDYTIRYLSEKQFRKRTQALRKKEELSEELKPNAMQKAFIRSILSLKEKNIHKALLLSATGTGKTYASAFAMKELHPSRILFVVHREQIARQAMNSYRRVFGNKRTYGLLTGNEKDTDAEFVFATVQTVSKPEVYRQFDKKTFDVIVLDECHHAGAESYQRIMSWFNPEFYLGMTASPDTSNYDIYALFDHNIAYEIRLEQALKEELLCPFHYFGITDIEIDGKVLDDQTGVSNFKDLVSDERVTYVLKQAEYYGYSGERVKGLVFCSRKEEAKELSAKFNERMKNDHDRYHTEVLTGEDSQTVREEVINRLISDTCEKPLDYIFTVDVFNEGVDIPEVNQIIMLRPTQSPVIFIQQLGRGLRKFEDKEYVVILDFIGNYMNNFLIPVALSGDRTYNKDAMRRLVMEGTRVVPGSSTIHFDEISRRRIFTSIDAARANEVRLLKKSYIALKNKLGRIPSILEFRQYGSIDVMKMIDKCGSYHAFLKKYEKDYTVQLSSVQEEVMEFLSKKICACKRVHEIAVLMDLICKEEKCTLSSVMKEQYGLEVNETVNVSVYRNLSNLFGKEEEKKKYRDCVLVELDEDGNYHLTDSFKEILKNRDFLNMVKEVLTFGKERYLDSYSHLYKDTCFTLYQKYTYEDVCRLSGWKKNMTAQNIGGYFYDADTKTLPVFINYDKKEDAIAYEDRFLSEDRLIALSKHPRRITSADVMHIYKRSEEDKDNRIFLFVRKNKDDNEAKEFYFLGEIHAEGEPEEIYMESTKDNAFEIDYRLDVSVRSDIYDYITGE